MYFHRHVELNTLWSFNCTDLPWTLTASHPRLYDLGFFGIAKQIGFIFHDICLFFRCKSLLESWGTTFFPDWQPALIFVWFTSKSHEHYPYYLLEHMHKKFEINWKKIKGGCQSGRKVVTHNSKSDFNSI